MDGLSKEQKRKLEKLSIDNEGVAFAREYKRATPDPTIIVSLGGLGGETLNLLKKKVLKTFGEVDHFYFLAFDTCDEDQKFMKKGSDEGYLEEKETEIMYDPSCASILNKVTSTRPDWVNEFMRTDFPDLTIDNSGARGIRQIGRVMLLYSPVYKRIMNRLHDIFISAMSHGAAHYEVMLIAGVSGGTGSGTVIDMSYLIRHAMEMVNIPTTQYSFSAYLYTPDVQFHEGWSNEDHKRSLSRNGYAAFKEIDYFMNLENHHGKYKVNIQGIGEYECASNIFDACTIVTGAAEMGGVNKKFFAMNNLSENLLDLLTDIKYTADGSLVQMAKAYSSNALNNLQAWYAGTGNSPTQYPKAANYYYQILGYSAVSVPRAEILAYCAYKLFQEVYEEFRRIDLINEDRVNTVLSHANLISADGLMDYGLTIWSQDPILESVELPQDVWPSKAEVKNGTDNTWADAESYVQDEINKIQKDRNPAYKAKLAGELIKVLKSDFDRTFDELGPYAVIELLTHKPGTEEGAVFSGVEGCIDVIRTVLLERRNAFIGYSQKQRVRDEIEEARANATKLIGSDMKSYVAMVCDVVYKERFIPEYCDTLIEVLNEVSNALTADNNDLWTVYTAVLDEVSRILQKDADYATTSAYHGNTYTYEVINLYEGNDKTKRLKNYLEDFISEKAVNGLGQAFISSMRDKRDDWVDQNHNDTFDAGVAVQDIFTDFMNQTLKTDIIEKFVVVAYSDQQFTPEELDQIWETDDSRKQTAIDSAATEIHRILTMQGGLMAKLTSQYDAANFPYRYIMATLKDTPNLSQAIKQKFAGSGNQLVLADSNGLSKYLYSRVVYNVPLYVIAGFDEWDEIYRDCIDNYSVNLGMHMSECGENNADWTRFPQPYILDMAKLQQKDYESYQDYKILMQVKQDMDEAIEKYGFVCRKDVQGQPADHYTLSNITKQPDSLDGLREQVCKALEGADDSGSIDSAQKMQIMKDCGYAFKEIPLTLAYHYLVATDRDGVGPVQVGDLYKTVRMSMYYIELLRENLKKWQTVQQVIDDESAAAEAKKKYQRELFIFSNGLKTGLIGMEGKEGKLPDVMYYRTGDDKETLVDLRAETAFDKVYILYNGYVEFGKLRPEIVNRIRETAKRKLQSDDTVDLTELAERVDEILTGDNYLGATFALDDLKQDSASSQRDYTHTEDPDTQSDILKVLRHFYRSLQRNLK